MRPSEVLSYDREVEHVVVSGVTCTKDEPGVGPRTIPPELELRLEVGQGARRVDGQVPVVQGRRRGDDSVTILRPGTFHERPVLHRFARQTELHCPHLLFPPECSCLHFTAGSIALGTSGVNR